MRIAIDAMGGDHAPWAVAEGALLARSHCSASLVLVGDEPLILDALGPACGENAFEVVHAAQAITMEESGPLAMRKKRDASLNVAMRMLAEGQVDAVVSAGNTSAAVASAKHYVGLLPGLRRPALAVPLPTEDGRPVLLDAGAHVQAGTVHLAQSATLAHIYLKATRKIDRPSIGLLNIGREQAKGTRAVQRAFSLIKRSGLNFAGNVEPNDLFDGQMDAVICEGFVGNIVLKLCEGISEGMLRALGKRVEESGPGNRDDLERIFDSLQKVYHYQYTGGAPLLGVKKPVVVAHGRSEGTAISSAIQLACDIATKEVCNKMSELLEQDSLLADFKYFNALLILENLRKKWGFAPK